MEKKKITVEFQRKLKYSVEIEVTDEEYKILKEVDGCDLWENNKRCENTRKAYFILLDYATEENEFDADNELENFEITEDENDSLIGFPI